MQAARDPTLSRVS